MLLFVKLQSTSQSAIQCVFSLPLQKAHLRTISGKLRLLPVNIYIQECFTLIFLKKMFCILINNDTYNEWDLVISQDLVQQRNDIKFCTFH